MNHRDGMNLSEEKLRGEGGQGGVSLEMAKDGVHFGVVCCMCYTAAHQKWLICEMTFCLVILQSISIFKSLGCFHPIFYVRSSDFVKLQLSSLICILW